MIIQRIVMTFVLLSLLMLGACESSDEEKHHGHFMDKIRQSDAGKDVTEVSSKAFVKGVKHVPVEGLETDGFHVVTRKDKMKQASCLECHAGGTVRPGSIPESMKAAHWHIENPHGNAKNVNCKTCHDSPDRMVLTGGIDFDHSYKLCAQCHFEQHRDWAGGAHGKRVGGWAKPRVVQNCASCHNPHNPGFEKRRPKTMATIPDKSLTE